MRSQLFSRVWFFETPWTIAHQTPLSMDFSRHEYWSVLPFPIPGDIPNPRMESASPALAGGFSTTKPPWKPVFKVALLETEVLKSTSPYGHVMTQLPSDLQMQYDQPF